LLIEKAYTPVSASATSAVGQLSTKNSDIYQSLKSDAPGRVTAKGYFIVDFYGAYRYRWFEVGVTIQNLLDSEWREAQFGNFSCTRDEAQSPTNPNYRQCGITVASRTGVPDVHYTPGVPFNLQVTMKAYF
jgi:outer membrane receptor protein involved in Fe transport